MFYRMSTEKEVARLQKMMDKREEYMRNPNELHIKLMKGNDKTGRDCWTVSLLPIIDCPNCSVCHNACYDFRNNFRFDGVINDRAKNSVIHATDPGRYWREVEQQIKENDVKELRINVGGDLLLGDLYFIDEIARENPECTFLFFTKNYDAINDFLDEEEFAPNIASICSRWPGMECDNRHNLPESHVIFPDGETTAPEYGAYFCGGNCSKCHEFKEGCWTLKNGEHVCFIAH